MHSRIIDEDCPNPNIASFSGFEHAAR
jgi:hypothetical protein